MRNRKPEGLTRRTLGAILLIAFAALPALCQTGGMDVRLDRQDALAEKGERALILKEAKGAVDRRDSAENRYLLGRAYGLVGELEKAREQFDWAMEKDPASPYAYHGLGVYYMMKKNVEQAEKELRSSLQMDPKFSRARKDLAKLCLMKEDRRTAERELLKVLEDDPDDLGARTILGKLYLTEKRHDRAIHELRIVLERRPNEYEVRRDLAFALTFDEKYDEAVVEWRKLLAKKPKDVAAYVFLKNILVQKGDKDGAIAVLEQLKKAVPNSPEAKKADAEIEMVRKGNTGPRNLEELLDRIDSEDDQVALDAMRVLVFQLRIDPPPKQMVAAVLHRNENIRVLAVRNLGQFEDRKALGLLEILLLGEKDRDRSEHVRGMVVSAMGKIGDPASLPMYLAALDDPSHYVFRLAVEQLRAATGAFFVEDPAAPIDPSEREMLTKAWREWWTTGAAFSRKLDTIESLRTLQAARMGGYLVVLLGDEDRMIAAAARKGFSALTGIPLGTEKDLDTPEGRNRLKRAAVEALLQLRAARKGGVKAPAKHSGGGKPAGGGK